MADLFAFYNKKKLPCRVCGKDFEGDDHLSFHQRRIHKACFKCRKCSYNFADPDAEFHAVELHEFPYCPTCYCDETGESICRRCHKLIEKHEKFVIPAKLPNSKFHTHCFTCAQCKAPLKEAYSTKAGKAHCLECYNPTTNIGEPTNTSIDVKRVAPQEKPKQVAKLEGMPRPTCELIQSQPEPEPVSEPSPEPAVQKEKAAEPTKPPTEEDEEAKKAFERAEVERLMRHVGAKNTRF